MADPPDALAANLLYMGARVTGAGTVTVTIFNRYPYYVPIFQMIVAQIQVLLIDNLHDSKKNIPKGDSSVRQTNSNLLYSTIKMSEIGENTDEGFTGC